MAVGTKEERKRHWCDALVRLNSGMGVDEVTRISSQQLRSNQKIRKYGSTLGIRSNSGRLKSNFSKVFFD